MFTINAKCAQSAETINASVAIREFNKAQKSLSAAIKVAKTFWTLQGGAARNIFAVYNLTDVKDMVPEVWTKQLNAGMYAQDGAFLHFAYQTKKDENGEPIVKKGKAVKVLALVPVKGWSVAMLAEVLEQSANYGVFAAAIGKTSDELQKMRKGQVKGAQKVRAKERTDEKAKKAAIKAAEKAQERVKKAQDAADALARAIEAGKVDSEKAAKTQLKQLNAKVRTLTSEYTKLAKKAGLLAA